jgi:hypothetical protein
MDQHDVKCNLHLWGMPAEGVVIKPPLLSNEFKLEASELSTQAPSSDLLSPAPSIDLPSGFVYPKAQTYKLVHDN